MGAAVFAECYAIPEAAHIRAQSALLPDEWSTQVVPYQHLGPSGGVALVPKHAIPQVLQAVGLTGHPAAILLVQEPDELGLRGYPRDSVTFSLSVAAHAGAREVVILTRWLVQLGFGEPVLRV